MASSIDRPIALQISLGPQYTGLSLYARLYDLDGTDYGNSGYAYEVPASGDYILSAFLPRNFRGYLRAIATGGPPPFYLQNAEFAALVVVDPYRGQRPAYGALRFGQVIGTPGTSAFDGQGDLDHTIDYAQPGGAIVTGRDFFARQVLYFTSGALRGLGRPIEKYAPDDVTVNGVTTYKGLISFGVAFPAAPAVGDQFMIAGIVD